MFLSIIAPLPRFVKCNLLTFLFTYGIILYGDFMFFDICVIGGGAAGLTAAITAQQKNKKLNIAIIERLDRFGKKISVTGNGRCNITNKNITPDRYHGKDVSFAENILCTFDTEDTFRFFDSLGVPLVFEGEKAFPRSLQASSVTDALRFKVKELGITELLETTVNGIEKKGGVFNIKADGKIIKARAVIVATGLLSGGVKLGCDGLMFDTLKKAGFKVVEPYPAIVQLKTETDFVKQLKGIKIDSCATLYRNGKTISSVFDEVLFCDYGLSGPAILQLSCKAKPGDTIKLDLFHDFTYDELYDALLKRRNNLKMRKNDEFLSGLLQKRLGQVVIKRAGINLNDGVESLSETDIDKISRNIKEFSFKVTGTQGFINSQVSLGGLATYQFDKNTLMCGAVPGLFAAGEILDITGDCGGFNLQWAWASGHASALGAVEFLK